MRRVCQEIKDCDVVIAFVPEQDSYGENGEHDPYKVIKRQLVRRKIPSQMITLPMLKKGWNKNVGQNLILGINAKLGYTNWCIDSMPGGVDLFVGLDVSRKDGVTVGASSFVFNSDGQLLEWAATDFQAYQESFNAENLENLLLDLYSRHPFERLVIHRDGKLQPEEFRTLQRVETLLKQEGLISLDAIEVLKSGFCRAAVRHSGSTGIIYTNPPRGWVWEHSYDEAVILTTGEREAKVSEHSSPRPLRIRKRMGDMDLLILAEQVYWLSEMQVGSTQTIRLPITTYYADRAAGFAQEGLLPLGFQNEQRLWFL
jgi:argonaute-like protein implicated in RNA metabolism and viral defense